MKSITLNIPLKLPSVNAVQNLHPMKKHKVAKMWKQHVELAINTQPPTADVKEFTALLGEKGVRYTITIVARLHRLYDQDNLFCKWVIDGLKGRLITDDSPKYIKQLKRLQQKIPKFKLLDGKKVQNWPETIITVEVIEN